MENKERFIAMRFPRTTLLIKAGNRWYIVPNGNAEGTSGKHIEINEEAGQKLLNYLWSIKKER